MRLALIFAKPGFYYVIIVDRLVRQQIDFAGLLVPQLNAAKSS